MSGFGAISLDIRPKFDRFLLDERGSVMVARTQWEPPRVLTRPEIIQLSDEVLNLPDLPLKVSEDIFRIQAVDMDWDIGCQVYEPEDPTKTPRGADGNKVGIFLIHGGSADHRYMDPLARLLAGKYGYKVTSMTYPGRLYLLDPSRNWPGDTFNPDGTVRTPIWCTDSLITPDQYEVVQDRSDLERRKKYGTVYCAAAKEGTEFYYRMAGWPPAFEAGMKAVCARHFPVGEWSIYAHGHSTGGPFSNMLTQRVPNVAGIGCMENSPFGYIYRRFSGMTWDFPFNWLTIRTWRDQARYMGPEAGPEGCNRLPMLMEEVLEDWDQVKHFPQFKAETFIHYCELDTLAVMARVTAKRLGLNAEETEAMVQQYQGYTRELSGPGVKPVPPLLLGIAEGSVDHKLDLYENHVLPSYAAMNPAPKVRLVYYHGGIHSYMDPEPGLPSGVGVAAVNLWHQAIMNGYYIVE